MIIDLYAKYKAEHYKEMPELNPLSFILRKAELGKNLTTAEWEWLDQHQLVDTKAVIQNQEDYRYSLLKELRGEYIQLTKNPLLSSSIYTTGPKFSVDSVIPLILYKVNIQERLTSSDCLFVGSRYHKSLDFKEKILKLGITEDIPCNNLSEDVLSKLENKTPLSAADIQWLGDHNVYSVLNRSKKQLSSLQKNIKRCCG